MENPLKKRLLITGASGFLGYRICLEALPEWRVFGICRNHGIQADPVVSIRLDMADQTALGQCFSNVRPHAVIHAGAISQPETCQAHPGKSRAVNVRATRQIATICADKHIPLAFTSTDLVFDGLNPPYAEDDPVSPVNVYGRHKVAAETEIRKIYPEAVVCRMPLMVGHAPGTGSGFLGWMVRTLQSGRRLTLFTDEFRSVVDTASAARGLLLFLGKPGGTYHLGGKQRLSRYDMGMALVRRMGLSPSQIEPLGVAGAATTARRSPDVSLDSRRAYAMGYDPADFSFSLDRALKEWGHC